jgi:N-acetylmuramic acid 6-phosphate (MurNAc-6-P) etherase
MSKIFELLNMDVSEQSQNYVNTKHQFQLHNLLTEQRHPKTWNLSSTIRENTLLGLQSLLSVDEDISQKFIELCKDPSLIENAVNAVEKAIREGNKIYIYGCGATGRLAKQVESSFWRPFWQKVSSQVKQSLPNIENRCIGEMTGADRALISSLEGFEDLQLIGKLQLHDHNIQKGDVVFAITEGGETSSVIGTILEALSFYGPNYEDAKDYLFFIYNNPDEVLVPLDRSRSVISNDNITKIRLFTGPQGISGSTRMQATSSETFLMGVILEHAICRVLQSHMSNNDLSDLGFDCSLTLTDRLLAFIPIQETVFNISQLISRLTDVETSVYAANRFSTYFSMNGLITVFTDSTERAPTFRLFPLDTDVDDTRLSWIQVWTNARTKKDAWDAFLQRPFKGMESAVYETPFSTQIDDVFLRASALQSLKKAGDDQQHLYDFSFSSENISRRGPKNGDLGVMVLLGDEIKILLDDSSLLHEWIKLFVENNSHLAIVLVASLCESDKVLPVLSHSCPNAIVIQLPINHEQDPLQIRQHLGLKMMLNAHSSGVMAKMGRVVGNTMTYVNPGNLKLIGRATFLILSHVNDKLSSKPENKLSYEEANAILFETINYCAHSQKTGKNSEVGLSIIRVLESIKRNVCVSYDECETILQTLGLESYLTSV